MRQSFWNRFTRCLACALSVSAAWLPFGCANREPGVQMTVPEVSLARSPEVSATQDRSCPIHLQEVTERTGIMFRHTDGSSGRHYIVEAMSTGLATFDFDGDGLIDIYFPNGAPLPGLQVDTPPRHALYRNLGDWTFQEVTDQAGVVCHAYGLGITIGDYDNDGFPDIYLNNFGENVLYRNNGDGTFSDVTGEAGVARGIVVGAGVCFLDADADGNLDLYVGNYIDLDLDAHVTRRRNGVPFYPSPVEYAPIPDTLYLNNGDGTFTDVSHESGSGRSRRSEHGHDLRRLQPRRSYRRLHLQRRAGELSVSQRWAREI
jgi:enediyne biosynthesis protein E4